MATIKGASSEKIFQIKKWLGLNENPDGDTKLKMGEATIQQNFKVTRDGNLQRRPGSATVVDVYGLGAENRQPIVCLWSGYVAGAKRLLGACGGKLYSFYSAAGEFQKIELGSITTSGHVHIFGFGGKAYILTGAEYKEWNGTSLADVTGYIPVVSITTAPAGGGTALENINRLNGSRRVWYSADGTSTMYQLPEKNISAVAEVRNLDTNTVIAPSEYTVNPTNGTVTFTTAPTAGTNNIEITYEAGTSFRPQVLAMKHSEIYNSTQDSRVFLYGDGSNRTIYSGIDKDGIARADYFPDLYEMRIGDENTAITGMIRHYARMIVFKEASTYMVSYGEITLSDGNTEAAFYSMPVNRDIGMAAMGQAQLVLNSPRTLFGNDLYEWKNGSSYSSNLTVDERQARRISDRISATLADFSTANCVCFDDNYNQEYWISYGSTALVNNYVSDTWFKYTGLDIVCMASVDGKLVFGTSDGKLKRIDYSYKSDDGDAIECLFESGSMSFGQDFMRKFSAELWVGMSPESQSSVTVEVETDRSSDNNAQTITERLMWFDDVDFANWTFLFDTNPKMHRLKIKAKKFVFYKLKFKSNSATDTATIVAADIKVRYTSFAK